MKTWPSVLKIIELQKYKKSKSPLDIKKDAINKARMHIKNLIELIPLTKSKNLSNKNTNLLALKELDALEQSLKMLVNDKKLKDTLATTLIRSVEFEPQMWIASSINDMFDRLEIDVKIRLCKWEKKCEWIEICE